MRAFLDVPKPELAAWLLDRDQPPMRERQLRRWIIQGRAEAFEQMSDLPRNLRAELSKEYTPLATTVARHLAASDGTHKLLLRLPDGQLIECVLIQEDTRRTACISTQVGCGMGCVFCASGIGGVVRNLTMGEILEQLLRLRNLLPTPSPYPLPRRGGEGRVRGERLNHIVVMGMGEPLANLDNLLAALEIATAKDGLGMSARHVTISTVGLPAKIRRLADLGKQYHLAVSLHAPNDRLRSRIVPTNETTGLAAILEAADYFFATTGRQVTYEYVLLGGVNDAEGDAEELGRLLRGRHAHVNLIPFNDVAGLPYRRPTDEGLSAFLARLRRHGISVKVRKRKGSEIDAACGQLRRSALGPSNEATQTLTVDVSLRETQPYAAREVYFNHTEH
jgi:23S rRNA (adenine2503-C2)-methyltransferase